MLHKDIQDQSKSQIHKSKVKFKCMPYIFPFLTINVQCFDLGFDDIDEFGV